MTKNHRKLKFLPKFLSIIISLALLIGFLSLCWSIYISYGFNNLPATKQESEVLLGLSNYLGVGAIPRDYKYDDWISGNGKRVPLSGKQIIIGTSGVNGVGKYGDFTTDEIQKVTSSFLNPLETKINKYFVSRGFKQNLANTNKIPNILFYSTTAFQRDQLYCLSHLSQMSDPFGYITCGTIDHNQIGLQRELSGVYQELKKENKGSIPITFRVDKVDGNYAAGSVSSEGGYQWLAEKKDGNWKIIWEGQDFPLCYDMSKYRVPASLYPGCFNPSTQKVQKSYQDPTEVM